MLYSSRAVIRDKIVHRMQQCPNKCINNDYYLIQSVHSVYCENSRKVHILLIGISIGPLAFFLAGQLVLQHSLNTLFHKSFLFQLLHNLTSHNITTLQNQNKYNARLSVHCERCMVNDIFKYLFSECMTLKV